MSPPTEPRATLHAIWQTRPGRRQTDRKIAGVAAAIARRYDIDPVLIRIAFVVAAFYGVGILLYLAAWVALPPDPADPPRGPLAGRGSSAHPIVLIAVVVATLAGAGSLLSGDPGVLVGLAVVGGLLYLLHQARGERGLAVAASTGPPAGSVTGAPTGSVGESGVAGGLAGSVGTARTATGSPTGSPGIIGQPGPGPDGQPRPPAWDPLGAAPFAWDLPEPGASAPAPPPPPPRRSRLTMVTLALALLAGGITAAIALSIAGAGGFRIVFGVMLAVVGLGLLIGAFRRTGRGLFAAAIPLLLLTYAATNAPVGDGWQGAGELRAAPKTVAELQPSYARSFGSIDLDLRQLDLATPTVVRTSPTATAAPGAPAPTAAAPTPTAAAPTPSAVPAPAPSAVPTPNAVPNAVVPLPNTPGAVVPVPGAPADQAALAPAHTRVSLEAGDIVVRLPADADVRLTCHADVGEVECLDGPGTVAGPNSHVEVTDLGADGVANGRPLELDVSVRTGSVEVTRG